MASFRDRVLSAVRRVPAGRVATYGDIAAAAGQPRAARAVGNIMRDCRTPGVPCHRIVAAGGRLGGYGGNEGLKPSLLRAEGIPVAAIMPAQTSAQARAPAAQPRTSRASDRVRERIRPPQWRRAPHRATAIASATRSGSQPGIGPTA